MSAEQITAVVAAIAYKRECAGDAKNRHWYFEGAAMTKCCGLAQEITAVLADLGLLHVRTA